MIKQRKGPISVLDGEQRVPIAAVHGLSPYVLLKKEEIPGGQELQRTDRLSVLRILLECGVVGEGCKRGQRGNRGIQVSGRCFLCCFNPLTDFAYVVCGK